jgi:hypothetical protein
MSILIGVAANKSIAGGNAVAVDDLLLDRSPVAAVTAQ